MEIHEIRTEIKKMSERITQFRESLNVDKKENIIEKRFFKKVLCSVLVASLVFPMIPKLSSRAAESEVTKALKDLKDAVAPLPNFLL